MYNLQSDNYLVLCFILLHFILTLCFVLYFILTLLVLTHVTYFYLTSTPITQLVAQSPSQSSLVLLVLKPHNNWHREYHQIISDMTPISRTMQELMNSTTHRWSHSWYRSKHCPSSIVQDGGHTTIIRTCEGDTTTRPLLQPEILQRGWADRIWTHRYTDAVVILSL